MAQGSAVPEFGNWENEENVPYTVYFEKARKNRTGGKINRNEVGEKADMVNTKPLIQASSFQTKSTEAQTGQEVVRPKHELVGENQQRRRVVSQTRHDIIGHGVAAGSPLHNYGVVSTGDAKKRSVQRSAASDCSIEQSPSHLHNQAKAGDKGNGVSSLSWEGKSSAEGNHGLSSLSWEKRNSSAGNHRQAHLTPGSSRLRSVSDDLHDHSAAVPKFGDWDETNPASADGYTFVFNKIKEDRQGGAGNVPIEPTKTSHFNGQKHYGKGYSKKSCCCFPWSRS